MEKDKKTIDEIINYMKLLSKSQEKVWNRLTEMVGTVPRFKQEAEHFRKLGKELKKKHIEEIGNLEKTYGER